MRPATYEHEAEAEFLKRLFSNRDGSLQNTSFGLLGPDGKKSLSRGGRSPQMVWNTSKRMVTALEESAGEYKPRKGNRSLPTVVDLRLGLNVAASDGLPLVVLVASKKKDTSLRKLLAELAWSDGLIAGAHYVVLRDHDALKEMKGHKASKQVQVLKPDAYGQSAEIVGAFDLKDRKLEEHAAELFLLAKGEPKDDRSHTRNGRRRGIDWKSLLPITDSGARKR